MSWGIILEVIEEYYDSMCSFLRQTYKWPVSEMDNLSLSRLLKIYEEAIEENQKGNDTKDLLNFRGMVS